MTHCHCNSNAYETETLKRAGILQLQLSKRNEVSDFKLRCYHWKRSRDNIVMLYFCCQFSSYLMTVSNGNAIVACNLARVRLPMEAEAVQRDNHTG